ncbi:outer membrane protein OmpA-like peptidoglycan-associated protein [Elusimicrobium simillimum]|uniref:OmpA family protein n=1 Tax=Elusimicrobium simillimum TaxID=3143438 RepID=UPI003C6F484A
MKHIKLLALLALIFTFAACSSGNKEQDAADPVIAKEKKKNERLAKQTSKEMLASRQIPSVDFEFDSTRLDTTAYDTLDKIAEFMAPNKQIKLIVEGHTDSVGSHEYNDWLSKARAMAIKSYIVSRGVHPDSIKVYGYGKRRPLTLDNTPEGRATNRRVVFIVTDRHWEAVY